MDKDKIVLIIEDDFSIYFLLEQMLKLKQASAVHAKTLAETKVIIHQIKPSVIFIDNRLPDGFGFEIIPLLRKLFPDTQIVAMTAQDIVENGSIAIESGANYFLEKPFFTNQFLESLDGRL